MYSGPRACIALKSTYYDWNWRAILDDTDNTHEPRHLVAKSLAGTVVNDDIGTKVASVGEINRTAHECEDMGAVNPGHRKRGGVGEPGASLCTWRACGKGGRSHGPVVLL